MEFNANTVLCRVCGDDASGLNYGAYCCEACRKFFKRSQKPNVKYRPCTKNQTCSILPSNRESCHYCRLKKCIDVGMSGENVRYGPVPKCEKAKMLAVEQKAKASSQEALDAELEDEIRVRSIIFRAHYMTCDYTKDKVIALVRKAKKHPVYAECPSKFACPLFPDPIILDNAASYSKEDFSKRFAPAIHGIVEFTKRIPGFGFLSQDDQCILLRASIFDVLMVRLARMFDSHDNSLICLDGQVLRMESFFNDNNQIQLWNSMFEFADGLNSLRLSDKGVGLFCAIVATASNRPGLKNTDLVCKIQQKMKNILKNFMSEYRQEIPNIFQCLMNKLDILGDLHTLHFNIISNYKMEASNQRATGAVHLLTNNSVNNQSPYASISHDKESAYSLVSVHPQCFPPEKGFKIELLGQHSQHGGRTAGSGWSTTDFKEEHDLVVSPIYIGSGLCVDEMKNPVRTSSLFSSGTHENREKWNKEVIQYVGEHHHTLPERALDNPASEHGSSSVENSYFHDIQIKGPVYPKICRVASPKYTDSSHFRCDGLRTTPTISVFSRPRSLVDEKVKDMDLEHASEKHEAVKDMPLFLRPIQAPAIINPHLEAYRHHKMFGAARRDSDGPASLSQVSLTNTHSALVRTLEAEQKNISK